MTSRTTTITLATVLTLGLGSAAMAQSHPGDNYQLRGRSAEPPYTYVVPNPRDGMMAPAPYSRSTPRYGRDTDENTGWSGKIQQDQYNDETGINSN